MGESMLSIGEAAKLIGVCENTLRDWDIERKFRAERTPGNHRRYTLDQVREYLDRNQPEAEKSSLGVPGRNGTHEILDRWTKAEHIDPSWSKYDRQSLAVILENTHLSHECSIGFDPILSSGQVAWVTREGWKRSKLRHLVSVQPMLGPCGLVYYAKGTVGVTIESEAVVAKTHSCSFSLFEKAKFEGVRDAYADALAAEIDAIILEKLPRIGGENLMDASLICDTPGFYAGMWDYVAGPAAMMDKLRARKSLEGVELIDVPTALDKDSFHPIVCGGKKPHSYMIPPVFCPYVLFVAGPCRTSGATRSVMIRAGWFTG